MIFVMISSYKQILLELSNQINEINSNLNSMKIRIKKWSEKYSVLKTWKRLVREKVNIKRKKVYCERS